jgi:photosystem II stability/assembly factor-like uncharacterized protein
LNEANGLLDLYVGSLYMKPDNPDVLLAAASENNWSFYQGRATAGVFLTEDGGEHWERVISGELFSVVEYCTSNPNVAYAASSRAVHRSDDGGRTWQRFSRANDTWGPDGIIAGFPIDMQCDPDNPMRVFVNNYLGGNFLSKDGGQSWVLSSDGYTGELVHQVVVAPGGPQTVISGSRSGVNRSDNGGGNWVGLANPPQGMTAKMNEVFAIAVDPSNADHLLMIPADLNAILISQDGGRSWNMGQQLGPVSEFIFAPSNPATVYAAVTSRECIDKTSAGTTPNPALRCDNPEQGLYVSQDGGSTWIQNESEPVRSGVIIAALAVHPGDARTIYVSMPGTGVLKSSDGGQTWSASGAGLPPLSAVSLAIDPSNPAILFAGVASSELAPAGGGVYRSVDGGQTWVQSSAGLNPEALVLSVAVDPTNSQIVYAGDYLGGVFVSTDGGQTWGALNEGLTHRMIKDLALSDDGSVLYAATWGDGIYRLGTLPEAPVAPTAEPTGVSTEAPPVIQSIIAPPTEAGRPTAVQPTTAPRSGPGSKKCGAAVLPLVSLCLIWLRQRARRSP